MHRVGRRSFNLGIRSDIARQASKLRYLESLRSNRDYCRQRHARRQTGDDNSFGDSSDRPSPWKHGTLHSGPATCAGTGRGDGGTVHWGAGLARGYLNRPDLTAERFVPDPYGKKAGARLYRTGDLGKWREDGNIEFWGRKDDQVKIGGYRVELNEVERALREYDGVMEALVVAPETQFGDRRLVAYVVMHKKNVGESRGLRAYLQAKLPEYMVPTTCVEIERLPLTLNGKVDRSALGTCIENSLSDRGTHMPPQTSTERLLCEIWAKTLGVNPIGTNDNFFDLGGDSISKPANRSPRTTGRGTDKCQGHFSIPDRCCASCARRECGAISIGIRDATSGRRSGVNTHSAKILRVRAFRALAL